MNWLDRLVMGSVPRDLHDQIVDDLREQLRDERERTRKLTRTVVKMKVSGGSIPRTVTPLARREPDAFALAIDANKHASRPAIRAALENYVAREVRKGTKHEIILERLNNWSNVTRDDDADDGDNDTIAMGV